MTITTSQFLTVNTGQVANDGTGDDLRTAFNKVNNNFANISDIGFNAANLNVNGDALFEGDNITYGSITAGSIISPVLYGNLATALQPNITQVGALSGLTVTGAVTIADITQSTQFNNGALVVAGGMGVAKDVYIAGNLYVANTLATSVSTLVSTSPLVYFDTSPAWPYNYDIGFYGSFTGGTANVFAYTGFFRDNSDNRWKLTSNVTAPSSSNMTFTNVVYDTLMLGNIILNAPTPTAITNGGTNATGNIGASGAAFNYGYFTNLTGTLTTATQNSIVFANGIISTGNVRSGIWSGTIGPGVSGANLTNINANAFSAGTIASSILGNSTVYIGTTAIALNRSSATQTLTGISIDGAAGTVPASGITGATIPTTVNFANGLITVGTLSSLAATGNITTTGGFHVGNAVGTTASYTGNITTTTGFHVGNAVGNTATYTGNISSTSGYFVGNGAFLTGLPVPYSNVNVVAYLSTTTNTITISNIIAAGNNITNIGSVANQFNTVFAKATSATYADLAENYTSDKNYIPSTVVIFGVSKEITTTNLFADTSVAGVISTNPAYLMNNSIDGLPVALRGRVPVSVEGLVKKGDLLVTSSIAGVAVSVGRDKSYGPAVFAKALEDKTTKEVSIIEAVII